MITLHVKPVYSQKSETHPIENGPETLSLRQHQVETYNAIQDPEIDVVFNTAMTGDGKSLSAYLPALIDDRSILAMYPTNELIVDQERQIKNYCQWFSRDISCARMFSERLYELRAALTHLRGQSAAIEFLAMEHPILLTNPDIFNLIANFQYLNPEYENPDLLIQKIIDVYDIFLFDEFHIYDVSQVVSVLTSMVYVIEQIRGKTESKKFVFLSATPSPLLLDCLKAAGLRYKVIEGNYHADEHNAQNWAQICAPFDLYFHAVGRQTVEWVEGHYHEIASWFVKNPNSRGAIIVNSVAAAKRIATFLKDRKDAGDFPLSVGENTGLTGREEKRFALLESDLLVGTSTVDVGVDFKINYLIFEGLEPGSWIQRLGRLGRHSGYERPDGTSVAFERYVAHSLLPKYVYERVDNRLDSGSEIDKAGLIELMRNEDEDSRIFSPLNDFRHYRKSWGWLHGAHVINTLGHPRLRENYAPPREKLTQIYTDIFESDIKERAEKWYYAIKQRQPEIIENAVVRFRGETPFTCGILDETDGEVKNYNLLWTLSNANVELIDKRDFLRTVDRRGLNVHKYRHLDIYLRLHSYRPEPERFRLFQRRVIWEDFTREQYTQLHALSGFRLDGPFPSINRINYWLERKKLLCLIRQEQASELRRILRLPPMFSIFPLLDKNGNEFSVAFSQDALLLHSQPYIWSKEEKDG